MAQDRLSFLSSREIRGITRAPSEERAADIAWKEGLFVRISRPSKKQQRKDGTSFFGYIQMMGSEFRIPFVVKRSMAGVIEYVGTHQNFVEKEDPILLVVNENRSDGRIVSLLRRELSVRKDRIRAEVAEAVNAPV